MVHSRHFIYLFNNINFYLDWSPVGFKMISSICGLIYYGNSDGIPEFNCLKASNVPYLWLIRRSFCDSRTNHKKGLTLKWMWDMCISVSGEIQGFTSNQKAESACHVKAVPDLHQSLIWMRTIRQWEVNTLIKLEIWPMAVMIKYSRLVTNPFWSE